ncbi:MAG: nuclear transport factor 2 family protein, partial [Gammaproteobacteria bacterium]|nr:nuclear transport factor 2 family protein [Gammaproteobacteria bacterium]
MAESELIALVKELDRCWTERRFDDLRRCLAEDAVFVAPDGRARVEGREAAIEGYREFMARARVDRFEARDHVATERGDA